jgi:hypothetical protein
MKNADLLDTSPGVARQPPTFFGSPKKVGKENDRTSAAPSGYPFMQVKKWEMWELAALKHPHFFIHFLPRTNGSFPAELQKQPRVSKSHLSKTVICYFNYKKPGYFNLVRAYAGCRPYKKPHLLHCHSRMLLAGIHSSFVSGVLRLAPKRAGGAQMCQSR